MATSNIPNAEGEAKFNMGLATLKAIRDLLDIYNKVSIESSMVIGGKNHILDVYGVQVIKSNTCNSLLLTSRPILNDKQKEKLEKLLLKTKLVFTEYRDPKTKMITKKRAYYSPEVNNACDLFVSTLTDELQVNKAFMPGKGESSLF